MINKIKTWCCNLKEWIEYQFKSLSYFYQDFVKGVKNLYIYLPIIWKDRNWDHAYIFYLLKFKLENTVKYLSKRKFYEGVERDVEIINTCVKLITKLVDGDYEVEYQEYYESVYWTEDSDKPGLKEFKSRPVKDNLVDYFKKYPNTLKQISPTLAPLTQALQIGMIRQQKAKRILFTLLERNIERWWD